MSFMLLAAEIWVFGGVALILHYLNPRITLIPFLMYIASLTTILSLQLRIFIPLSETFIVFINSTVVLPVILMSVLLIYITHGSFSARQTILSIIVVSLVTLLWFVLSTTHLALPNPIVVGDLDRINAFVDNFEPLASFGSFVAFLIDLVVISVLYQWLYNHLLRLPGWFLLGLTLLLALWIDSVIFLFVADLGTDQFFRELPGDLLGKSLATLLLWPLMAFYLIRVAPTLPEYQGALNRPSLDVLTALPSSAKAALQRVETEWRNEEAFSRQITSNINEGLWLAEPGKDSLLYANPAYYKMWNVTPEEVAGNPIFFFDHIHPDDRPLVLARVPSSSDNIESIIEYRVVLSDGSIRWHRDRAFPIRNERGEIIRIGGIKEDITELKEFERHREELALSQDRIKVMREFIGEASHDLKSPLTAINLKIYALLRTDDEEKRRKYLQDLQDLTQRTNRLIDDLFTLARLDNVIDAEMMEINVNEMLAEIKTFLQPIAESKQLDIQLNLTSSQTLIKAEPQDLFRALFNLISNAINYTPPGGQVTVQTQTAKSGVNIDVVDTGIGIPPEDLPNIFGRFFRASNARSIDPSGTGLGLAIVKKVVETYQGQIDVVSTIGQGTRFTIFFPVGS